MVIEEKSMLERIVENEKEIKKQETAKWLAEKVLGWEWCGDCEEWTPDGETAYSRD